MIQSILINQFWEQMTEVCGAGVLLEIARQLALKNSSIGVDIILFDAEDYGQPDNSQAHPYKTHGVLALNTGVKIFTKRVTMLGTVYY